METKGKEFIPVVEQSGAVIAAFWALEESRERLVNNANVADWLSKVNGVLSFATNATISKKQEREKETVLKY